MTRHTFRSALVVAVALTAGPTFAAPPREVGLKVAPTAAYM